MHCIINIWLPKLESEPMLAPWFGDMRIYVRIKSKEYRVPTEYYGVHVGVSTNRYRRMVFSDMGRN